MSRMSCVSSGDCLSIVRPAGSKTSQLNRPDHTYPQTARTNSIVTVLSFLFLLFSICGFLSSGFTKKSTKSPDEEKQTCELACV